LILPKHIYEGSDPKTNPANFKPIGSGPFKFSKWQPGSYVELARNASYFKLGKPHLERLIIQIMPDAAARLLSFESGEVDFLHAYVIPYEEVSRLRKNPKISVVEHGVESSATNEFLSFNHRQVQLKDKRVRQAIAYAIDRNAIRDKAIFGLGKVAHSQLNSGTAWAWTDRYDDYKTRDIAKANALLDTAGFPRGADGQRFRLRLFWDGGKAQETRSAALIKNDLGDVGIAVDIQPFDRPTFIDRVFNKWDFDLASYSLITGPDPALSVSPRYRTKQIIRAPFVNAMAFSNAEVDELFDTEFMATSRADRTKMWHRIQQIMMDELPSLPIFEYPNLNLVSAKFADVVTLPSGYLQCREDAYLR
jgi:peptide/nickel transport system substrate-binding protein